MSARIDSGRHEVPPPQLGGTLMKPRQGEHLPRACVGQFLFELHLGAQNTCIYIRIIQSMISGIPFVLGLSSRM